MGFIRPAAVAGRFYPGAKEDLSRLVGGLLDEAYARTNADAPVPKAIVAPHAGYVYSGAVAASAYARLAPAADSITRIVLLGPCHRVAVRGFAVSSADAFATPLGDMPVDTELREAALQIYGVKTFDETHTDEHALEVHLPFLQTMFPKAKVLPIVVGDIEAGAAARVIETLWGGPETLIVVSSDLSHYLDYDTAAEMDARTSAAVEAMDGAAIGSDQACGRAPLRGFLALAKSRGMAAETVDLRNSGDTAGSKDRVVGYGAWVFTEAPKSAAASADSADSNDAADAPDFEAATKALLKTYGPALLELAAASVSRGFKVGRPVQPDLKSFPEVLTREGACFVTLKKAGRLRGCIGSPQARRPLAQDIAENAFAAAFKDPRFDKLTAAEIAADFELSISVLSPASEMTFTDEAGFTAQLRPNVDGLIIADQGKRALFLPSVWRELPKPEVFLAHLKKKAGMAADHWSAGFTAHRFTAEEVSSAMLDDPAALWRKLG
ncbi:MAG: AmmeMemoRadiSam system protein B [Rhodospirillales bacterium]